MPLTTALTVANALHLAGGDNFVAAILDIVTRKARGLYPFDAGKPGPWCVTSREIAAMAFHSRFAGNGAGWPAERDVNERLESVREQLLTLGIEFKRNGQEGDLVFWSLKKKLFPCSLLEHGWDADVLVPTPLLAYEERTRVEGATTHAPTACVEHVTRAS